MAAYVRAEGFTCSHPIELTELGRALDHALADEAFEDRSGIVALLRSRVTSAHVEAAAADRENQLRGGRAAND